MLWDLINPSDAIIFETDDPLIAAMVCAILGPYGANNESGDVRIPVLGIDQWIEKHYGIDFDTLATENYSHVVDALETIALGNFSEYKFYQRALKAIDDPIKRQQFIDEWDDEHRTSLNNICKTAKHHVQRLRMLNG